jgi:hypothetical protein
MDAYRITLLRELFPGARLRLIHLTRNPAAAINGLIDGWLHHGFFSHNLAGRAELNIADYSDRGQWGRSWWNFDLPPGWRDLVRRQLVDVCAAQWLGAHTSIMTGLRDTDMEVLRLRAEHVLSAGTRDLAVRRVLEFCDVRGDFPHRSRVVVATRPPTPGRWRARAALLKPTLQDPEVMQCATSLGYCVAAMDCWT